MLTLVVPYHLDERLDGFSAGEPVDRQIHADLPEAGPWQRMAELYEHVADAVTQAPTPPLVVSGDCTTSLGVLAGLQRAGRDPAIVWFDAHADFHTEQTTTSGYLGGLPLALAAGVGTLTLPAAPRLRPVLPSRVLLIDARDTDPPEQVLLRRHGVVVRPATQVREADLPPGELYLHVDVDVCDPLDVPDLLYPAPGGPSVRDVIEAVRRVVNTGKVAAAGLALTWRHDQPSTETQQQVLHRLRDAISSRA